ncbi:Uncharacterized protein APZ42_013921 [Daphnia magna]|uniref:Uncharacterized protein n=1 Tax=Daphnia magna TaxID=35525 RepID=A0A162QDJ9_9CRUS|nr:Uncharacterized protein APZ42_013921 [Daphnia magna]
MAPWGLNNRNNINLNRRSHIHKSLDGVLIHHTNIDANLLEMVKCIDGNITQWTQIFFKEVIFYTYWNSLTKS